MLTGKEGKLKKDTWSRSRIKTEPLKNWTPTAINKFEN